MKHLQDIVLEGLLDIEGNDENMDHVIMREAVEKETGWTLSSDGKYILSGTKHFPAEMDTQFSNNGEWFEKLVNCAKKYKLKIQPFGLLVLDSHSIHLLEDADIEYICELKIYVNNPVNVDLSKIKSPIHRISLVEKRNSWCNIDSIILPKIPTITTVVDLFCEDLRHDMLNVKNLNCNNLIINLGRHDFSLSFQAIVDQNPQVHNVYFTKYEKGKTKYYQVKLKGREVMGIMGKSENALVSKDVLEDFYQRNADFKQWYEKHM